MARLAGKCAVITGAAGGIGSAAVTLFLEEGADVFATDLKAAEGGGTHPGIVAHDIASQADWSRVAAGAVAKYGRVDILLNVAGVYLARMPPEEIASETWNRVMNINVTGAFMGMRTLAPIMAKTGGGAIINVASLTGLLGDGGLGPYPASKGALRQMSKAAAVQYGPAGIRVNSVYPGLIQTPMIEALNDEQRAFAISKQPLGRIGLPLDVARAMLFLVSDDASFISGAELLIDGGYAAH